MDFLLGLSYFAAFSVLSLYVRKKPEYKSGLITGLLVLLATCSVLQLLLGWQSDGLGQYTELAVYKMLAFAFSAALALTCYLLFVHMTGVPQRSMAELQDMVHRLEHEISERKRAEQELQKSKELLRQLAAYQEQVKEDERKRIAREIHDDLGQNLMALRIDVSTWQERLGNSHPLPSEKVAFALEQIDAIIKAVRAIINNLRPSVLDLGLYAAIEWQVDEFERRTGILCDIIVHDDEEDVVFDDQRATALFRILQESLTNVARHARASTVQIELKRQDHSFLMKITDDGVGIYPGCRRKPNSYGLLGIGERVSMLGGEFGVESSPGTGTTLNISIPLEKSMAPAALGT